ncbi:BMP family ABC transporter substrate-binding protein [Solwaraspora sp. WMMD406]|uniref:BMP family ABC transporter substrate-binding protein n=1 Tax=Solwaraspora sp. WMMD406 TaxID=3016095 RepID=UPI002415A20A|nr:BMP family ABC transporter substrate-binding protein [Solwaraspora sp. WMMD406]MDG4764596.1 BMP family ABC transporter substrate-binding protein [Solwaraspora sp. WMMD406]
MSMRRLSRRRPLVALAAAATTAVLLAGCATNSTTAAPTGDAAEAPGTGGTAIGFIFVGPKDDYGYNQAAYEGSQAVAAAYPDLEVLTAENVPEDDNATRVMESMIRKGAKIIFATSYGHKDPALKVAAANPDVVVLQQGNIVDGDAPPNFGTYFGTVYEPVYLAGIIAGTTTKSNKLGYVYAFPISQTLDNINAFQLGAASVNPDVQTYVVNTSSWCDPAKQAEATNSLLSQGVDVISQHQDCTATIIRATEAAGAYTVGYHADASDLAPTGWLTGSEWDWGPLYTTMVETILAGEFTGSEYNANYRVGLKTGDNPFVQSAYGPAVTDEAKALVEQAKERISAEDGSPFAGPVVDQAGTVRVPAGTIPDYQTIESIDYFVEGVVGQIPSS